MSSRVVMRYVPFTVQQDPTAHPTYVAECVIGEKSDCGATSGEHHDPAPVEEWMRKHVQDTQHTRYRRTFTDYAVWEPAEEIGGALAKGAQP